MSYIAHSIKLCREETEDDSSFLNFLILVAVEVAKEANALPYRFYIEPNNTIH